MNLPTFQRLQSFITLFEGLHQLFLSWTRYIQSIISYPISLRPILILFSHLRLRIRLVSSPHTFRQVFFLTIFRCLCRSKGSVQFQGPVCLFLISWYLTVRSSYPHPTLKLEDKSLSAVRNCWFSIFAATVRIWSPYPPPSESQGRTMPW
jgi:hypothetical protein